MTATRKRPAPSRNGETPPADGFDGRGADGRFVAGNRCGHGNAFGRQVAERRKAVLAAVTAEDIGRVARKLYEQALAGDVPAAKVLLAHVCGKPLPAPNPDRVDLDELSLLLQAPDIEVTCLRGTVAPALAAQEVLRGQIKTAEGLVAALQARMQELREDLQRRATPAEWLDIEDIADAAGLNDGDADDDQDDDEAADDD